MDKIKKAIDINLKSNTELLIEYLEAVIGDEMILNSFIRGIEIIKESQKDIIIATKTQEAFNLISENYIAHIKDGIKNIYQKNLEVNLVVSGDFFDEPFGTPMKSSFLSPKFTFENYIEGTFNAEAIKMSKALIKNPGKYSPFFLSSASGLGKTHLLHSIGNEFVASNYSVNYIEPNTFTKKIVELSRVGGSSISSFIEELLSYDVLIFDDIQNLGDRAITLRVLFQLLNTFIENHKQIIIASDKSPSELSGFESRFITRFSSGLTSKIDKPNTNDLIKVLEFKLGESNLSPERWEREAIKFIVRNNSSSIRSIEGAVKRISFYTEDTDNIKYTYTVISNIFKELAIDPMELTPTRIISVVATYYKINKNDMVGKSRKASVVIARHMAIWMIRKIIDMPYKEIGKLFGNRDHSTIISSIKTIDKKMSINNIIKVAAERIEQNIKSVK